MNTALNGKTIAAMRQSEWHLVIVFTDGTELLIVIKERFTDISKLAMKLVAYLDGVELT